MALQIKKGDQVRVRCGPHKGQVQRVLSVTRDASGCVVRVLVEHVNMVHRHTRSSRARTGGIVEREAPIHASNVMLVDPKTSVATRFGAGKDSEGRKVRISRKSGSPL